MAIINGLYIHVTDEDVVREVNTTSHPVESGIPTTDLVRPKAVIITLSGKIVNYGHMKASQVLSKIKSWQSAGSLVDFKGRNSASSMQIIAFDTKHPNTNHGGADFNMELRQVRIAKSSYVPKKSSTTTQKNTAKKSSTAVKKSVKVGDTVVFKGGPVYVSSDSTKAAATRSRSTCKVTQINTATWAKHQYHLKSTDGKKVYGWCDLKNIEGVEKTSTSGKTTAGTQQTKSSSSSKKSSGSSKSKKAVYHPVKRGDTIWALVTGPYKYLNKSCSWVINNNPKAFSRKGDATTLKVGVKLLMGYK